MTFDKAIKRKVARLELRLATDITCDVRRQNFKQRWKRRARSPELGRASSNRSAIWSRVIELPLNWFNISTLIRRRTTSRRKRNRTSHFASSTTIKERCYRSPTMELDELRLPTLLAFCHYLRISQLLSFRFASLLRSLFPIAPREREFAEKF